MLRFFENYAGYMFDIGILSVDSFFVSSRCLVTYLYLKIKTNKELIKPINCREKLIDFFQHNEKIYPVCFSYNSCE